MRLVLYTLLSTAFVFSPCALQTTDAQNLVERKMTKAEVAEKYSAEERSSIVSSREYFLFDNNITSDYNIARWTRDIYRILDDTHAENAALFLPEESGQKFVNLFSLLLNLLNTGQIDAYRFDSESTTIEDKGTITLPEILDMNNIPFTLKLDNTVSFSRLDLQGSDVKTYYLKEKWVFDQRTGKYAVIPEAICPVLHHQESYDFFDGATLKTPLFWIHVDDIAPYLAKTPTPGALSTLNTIGSDLSLYDILRCRLFVGDIYQIGLRNLVKYADSPEQLREEQMRAEQQLQEILQKFKSVK